MSLVIRLSVAIWLLFATGSCLSCDIENEHKEVLLHENMVLVHCFFDLDGKLLGKTYVRPIKDRINLFSDLVIVGTHNNEERILYRIDSITLINRDGSIDEIINGVGFVGYSIEIKNRSYIVMSCCGDNISDDITIEFNYVTGEFQLQRSP